jgi:NADH-quinone oxidoreductase subunit E
MPDGGKGVGVLSEHAVEEISALPARFPEIRSAVLPALDVAQDEIGYLTKEAMAEVARLLRLDPGYVEGVATFYTLLHLEPIGKHHFYVCTNLSCALRGAYEICDHIKRRIGVEHFDEVSADGLFSLEEVECLGACEFAPMMRYQRRYHYDLTPEKLDALIEAARRSEKDGGPAAPGAEKAPAPTARGAARKPSGRRSASPGPTKEDSAELNE